MSSKASERAAAVKGKLGDEEYQANLKKNAAETWTKTTSTLSSWWSTAATSVSNVLTEDGATQNVTLYNRDPMGPDAAEHAVSKRPKKKMAALSSDQYFGQNHGQNAVQNGGSKVDGQNGMDVLGMNGANRKGIDEVEAPFPAKRARTKQSSVEAVTDDFDEWGFGGDADGDGHDDEERKHDLSSRDNANVNGKAKGKGQGVESLLDFGANETVDNTVSTESAVSAVKEDKDGNSSDDLDAFFNEMTNEELGDTEKAKSGGKRENEDVSSKNDDLLTNDNGKKSNDDDDWGWD